ncbi:hypothetical protein AG1IA_07495 [Rhizoctonia solani AG-1 IA]|uniref:Uncharacterized protein n=1 Tax=Thanatephorus cucumeris (strain AG1-IA) TaxID=983506 RepID=L8WNX7_THACA|nr:hypothetical protein AG1IA_07495 [Rhizoctonia solani AG-1 IA]
MTPYNDSKNGIAHTEHITRARVEADLNDDSFPSKNLSAITRVSACRIPNKEKGTWYLSIYPKSPSRDEPRLEQEGTCNFCTSISEYYIWTRTKGTGLRVIRF